MSIEHTDKLVGGPSFFPAKLNKTIVWLLISRDYDSRKKDSRLTLDHQILGSFHHEHLNFSSTHDDLVRAYSMYRSSPFYRCPIPSWEEIHDRLSLWCETKQDILAIPRLCVSFVAHHDIC
jgi:hypothetical protein